MRLKAILVIVIALALSGCGHLRSSSEPRQTESVRKSKVVLVDEIPTPDISNDNANQTPSTATRAPNQETVQLPVAQPRQAVDILQRMRQGFRLPDLSSKYVSEYERWDTNHPTYLKNLFVRAEPFLYYIVDEIEKRGLPMELALLPAIESAYKPNAVSRSKAAGLWQFIPSTGRGFGLRQDWWYDGRRDVVASTKAALDYLTQLNTMFDGDWFLTLAAYNAGPGTVSRAIKSNRRAGKSTGYTDLRLRSETRRYIPKLLALKNIINNPTKYNFTLPTFANKVHFEVIELPGQVDIQRFAKNANIDQKTLKHLNPGYKRWATPPNGPHRLLVPSNSRQGAMAAKDLALSAPTIDYRNHTIKRGDNLSAIARRYGVTVSALQSSNNLRGTNIREGRNLIIPIRGSANSRITASTPDAQNKVVHRVQRGDTLWSIARHYKVKLQELVSWNNISKNQILKLNQSLLVFVN